MIRKHVPPGFDPPPPDWKWKRPTTEGGVEPDETLDYRQEAAKMSYTYMYVPQGGAIPLTHEQKMARAIREIREAIQPWGDGDRAQIIRAVLARNGV